MSATCLWPIWTVKDSAYRHAIAIGRPLECGAEVVTKPGADGTPVPGCYCARHAARAFVRHDPFYASKRMLARLADHVPGAGQAPPLDVFAR